MPPATRSNTHLKVRRAGPEDALEAWRLLSQLQDFVGLEITPYQEFAPRWDKALSSPDFEAFIAEEGGETKGLAVVWYRESLSHGGPVALIDEFVVAEGSRGKGIGTRLMEQVLEECFRKGCVEVEVVTEADNFAARGFYHKLGFHEVGILLEKEKGEGSEP